MQLPLVRSTGTSNTAVIHVPTPEYIHITWPVESVTMSTEYIIRSSSTTSRVLSGNMALNAGGGSVLHSELVLCRSHFQVHVLSST